MAPSRRCCSASTCSARLDADGGDSGRRVPAMLRCAPRRSRSTAPSLRDRQAVRARGMDNIGEDAARPGRPQEDAARGRAPNRLPAALRERQRGAPAGRAVCLGPHDCDAPARVRRGSDHRLSLCARVSGQGADGVRVLPRLPADHPELADGLQEQADMALRHACSEGEARWLARIPVPAAWRSTRLTSLPTRATLTHSVRHCRPPAVVDGWLSSSN